MAAKFVDEARCTLRFSDLPAQSQRMLPPIQGYENMPLVTLEKAVEPLVSLVPDAERMVWTVKQSHFDREHDLTEDESASILLYTMEWAPRDKSFYIILNNTLQEANRNLLKPWFLYLRLVMTSLAKLPSDSDRLTVFRGVKLDLRSQYPRGSIITWWGFSSCTTSIEVLNDERFLGRTETRTLFNIECQSAKSIKSFSFYPEEEEVLLPPGRQFQVIGCLDQGNGLHIIQMKEIQPKFPLINPVPPPAPSKPKPHPIVPTSPPDCGNPKLQKYIDALYSDPILTSLDLRNNQIGDEGAQHLANALQINKTLTSLDLYRNKIGSQGAQHLANALQINKTLTSLDLGYNKIGDDAMKRLKETCSQVDGWKIVV